MNLFTLIFLAALGLSLTLEYWLMWRQSRHVAAHRTLVPGAFADRVSLPEHQKAADYTEANLGYERVGQAIGTLLLLGWTLAGGLEALSALWQQAQISTLWQGIGLLLSMMLIGSLLDIPLSLWKTFGIEAKFGFNKMTGGQFIKDLILQLGLMLILGTPLLLAVLWLMEQAGHLWWLYAWLVWIAFSLFITWAFPTWIAPLFNKFKPLDDGSLKTRLEGLLARCGFASKGMYVMDGSKRSAHGNAYFTGFGKNKRIVFFDTLLTSLEEPEIEAVLAHELGHFKRKHVLKTLLLSAMISLVSLALLGWLAKSPWFYQGLGVSQQSPATALALFILTLPVFAHFLTPILSWLSRKHEYEADDFAAAHADARAMIGGLLRMYRENAATLTPDPLYSAFHHSHPPAPLRIANLSAKL